MESKTAKLILPFFLLTLFSTKHPLAAATSEEPWKGWCTKEHVLNYFHNSELQRQWAHLALGLVSLSGKEDVLDLGCGDGKVTQDLAHLVAGGSVLGVDPSEEMIDFAAYKFTSNNLHFTTSPLSLLAATKTHSFDLVTAFCSFHLISETEKMLQHVQATLKPEGKLLAVIPYGSRATYLDSLRETFSHFGMTPPWSNPKTNKPPKPASTYVELLTSSGFTIEHLVDDEDLCRFYSKQELVDWMVGTLSANLQVPLEIAPSFFSHLLDLFYNKEKRLLDEEGHCLWPIGRIVLVARTTLPLAS